MFSAVELLADPAWATTFSLTRTAVTVGADGRAVTSSETRTLSGVILPASDRELARLPEGDRSTEVLAVYCMQMLTVGTQTLAPDEITWRGLVYRVRQVQDWTTVGGCCQALAVAVQPYGREVTS